MRIASPLLLLLLLLPGCGLAALRDYHDALDALETESSSSTGDDDGSSTGWPGPISTLTTDPSESDGDASTAGDTDGTDASTTEAQPTGDEPQGPPLIVGDPMIAPNPIQVSGLVTVTVDTQDVDAVTMTIDPLGEAEEIELAPGNTPGTYVGQIEAFTGLDNGWHDLVLVPARGEEIGEAVPASFEIALPKPGTEGFFEAGDLIGNGEVKAIGMLPDKRLIELGTRTKQGKKSCYLRRRDPDGGWVLADVIDLVPDLECEARDLKISSDGAMFVLLQVQGKNGPVWRLLEYATWAASPKVRGVGSVGEQANALAEHEGTVAVCGTAPTQHIDELDVLIKIFRPNNLSGGGDVLDYKVNDDDADHFFRDSARDCVFTGDGAVLTVVGDTYGPHTFWDPYRSRQFTLSYDLAGQQEPEWSVSDGGGAPQSFATAVDVDDQGNLVIVGNVCDDACAERQNWIWLGESGASLGVVPGELLSVSDVRWSPAGYAVVATPGEGKDFWAFTVRAFYPDASLAWTYKRKDPPQIHLSRSVFVGPFGEVWIGGWGANGYPAIAKPNH